jgi:hypothetical protein
VVLLLSDVACSNPTTCGKFCHFEDIIYVAVVMVISDLIGHTTVVIICNASCVAWY